MGWVSVVGVVVNRAAGPRAPQAIAIEFDAVGVVDEAVEDGVSVCGVGYSVVPGGHIELACDDGGLATVAVLKVQIPTIAISHSDMMARSVPR